MGARHLSHYLSFVANALLLGGLCAYLYACARHRDPRVESQYGPLALCCAAFLLVMADPSRHVLQHVGVWPAPGSSQYDPTCEAEIESFVCLSTVGWLFVVVFTYCGFALLFTATLWNARICTKLDDIRQQWRILRGHSATAQDATAAPINDDGPARLSGGGVVSASSFISIDEGDEAAAASPIVRDPESDAHESIAPVSLGSL